VAYSHYERLSAMDATFLGLEDENCPMHVGAVAVFEPGPLSLPEGGVDIDRFSAFVESVLMPRYRQRIARVPLTGRPIWVDDPRFNLHYHVRHLRLPHPGQARQLKRLAGHVMALPLDRSKPLWELWVVEGLANGRFAVITKTHHCMIDGVGSADVMSASMRLSADSTVTSVGQWLPRAAPGPLGLALSELGHRVGQALGAVRVVRNGVREPRRSLESLRNALAGVGEALESSMHRTSPTPLNVDIGPHRRFDWLRYDLEDVKEVKNRLGGTVNDVILANVAGALRHFLQRRGEDVDALDFRAMIPVNIRTADDAGAFGNRVASVAARLPLDEPDPARRLARIVETTQEVKHSRQSQGIETIEAVSEWGLTRLFIQLSRFAALTRPFNVVVTNVPGPQVEAYLLGSPLREVYPLVPLFKNQALGIALFSYDGGLFWGLNADWDAVPDLHDFVDALRADFERLRQAGQVAPPRAQPVRSRGGER
jgi:diacylglycerol O-acyltransferase